jgi:type VI secretion system secreted protein Hcp
MAADIFLKLGDIKGESQDDKHKDEIEILSFSWGVSNAGSMAVGGGGGTGRATISDFSFMHYIDKASAVLLQKCAKGDHIPEGTLVQRKQGGGQQEFLTIKFKDVLVTSVQQSASDGVSESFSISPAFVEVEYKPQKKDGSLDAGIKFTYDLKAQKIG